MYLINYCSDLKLVFSMQLRNEWRTFQAEKPNFDCFVNQSTMGHNAHSPECTAMKAIYSQNTVNVACKKN